MSLIACAHGVSRNINFESRFFSLIEFSPVHRAAYLVIGCKTPCVLVPGSEPYCQCRESLNALPLFEAPVSFASGPDQAR